MPLSRIQAAFAYSLVDRLQTVVREEKDLLDMTMPIADALRRRLLTNVVAFPATSDIPTNDVADDFQDAAETLQILVSSLLADVEGALLEYADQLAGRALSARAEQLAT